MQEVLERVDTQNATIQEMLKQIEKLQQDKYILRALITELDVNILIKIICQIDDKICLFLCFRNVHLTTVPLKLNLK